MKKLMKVTVSAWLLVLGAGVATAAELPAGYTAVEYIGERVTVTCDGQHVEWTGSKAASVEGKFYENSGSGDFGVSDTALPFARELASGADEQSLRPLIYEDDSSSIFNGGVSIRKGADADGAENQVGMFVVSLDDDVVVQSDLDVAYSIDYSGSTAIAGQHYMELSGVVTIPAGANSATIKVFPLYDAAAADPKMLAVKLTEGSYSLGEAASAQLSVMNCNVSGFWQFAPSAETLSDGIWRFACTANGLDLTVGAPQAYPGAISPLDFSKPIVNSATREECTIVSLNSIFNSNASAAALMVGELKLPGESVTTIGVGTFRDCKNATGSIVLPSGLTKLSGAMFYHCSNLSIDLNQLPQGITTVEPQVFGGCSGAFGDVDFPNVTVFDGRETFNKTAITSIRFGAKIGTGSYQYFLGQPGGQGCFDSCKSLTNVIISASQDINFAVYGSSRTAYPSAFDNCTALTELDFSGLTKWGGRFSFSRCSNLKRIILGGVEMESLAFDAFNNLSSAFTEVVFKGAPPNTLETPYINTLSHAVTTTVSRANFNTLNSSGKSWLDYAANGEIHSRRSTFAADRVVVDPSLRPLVAPDLAVHGTASVALDGGDWMATVMVTSGEGALYVLATDSAQRAVTNLVAEFAEPSDTPYGCTLYGLSSGRTYSLALLSCVDGVWEASDPFASIFVSGVPGLYQALYTTGQTVKTGDPAVGGEIVPGALFCSTSDRSGVNKLTYTVGDKTYTMGGNTTAAYKGVMRMDSGVVYWFAKHFDDWGMVQVVDLSTYVTNNLIDNSSWQDVPIKSYTPSHTGWYGILLRVGQGGGGIGPSSEPFKTTMQAGMLWNTNGLSTCTAANCSQWHRFMNDDDNGIFLYTDIPDEPRYENGGTVSISATSLTLTTDMTFGKGTLTLVVTDTAGVEKTTALDFYEKGAHIVANMGGLTSGRSYEVGLRAVSEYGNTSYVSFGTAYFGNVTVTKGVDARTDTMASGTFVVSRPNDSEATHFPLEVQYTVSGATPGTHYEELPLKVTIPAGAASAEIDVRPIWSGLADKSLNLTLTSKRNYFVGSPGSSAIDIKGAPYDPFVRFVATTGNDSNDGCTDVTAFLTLDRALAAVSSLDHATIKVLPGTYVPTNRIDNYGRYFSHYEITRPVTILGMGSKPEDVHFKSTCTDAGTSKSRVFFVNNEAAKLKNLLITGGRSGAGNEYPNFGSLGGGGVYLESQGGTVEDCVISNCYLSGWNTGGGGIHMWNGRILRTKFVNNYSGNDRDYDFAGAALCARNGYVENCLMVNNGNGADNNGYGPVHILGNTVLMNCTIAGNHGKESAAVVVQGTSAKVINCAIFNNDVQFDGSGHAGVYYLKNSATGAQFINCAADRDIVDGIDCIMSKSGGFVNKSERDYHLAVASVCRDSANEDYYLPPFATSVTDLDGKDRVIGDAIDIGAYELQSAGPCEGGEVIEYEEGVWVVTPNPGVTEIGITDLPDGVEVIVPPTVSKVTGVPDGRIRIRDGAVDVTGKFSIKDGVIERLLSTVTVGEVVHVTAAWTSGDGTETNGVVNGSFEVPCGAVDVKVIFTPADGYGVDKTEFKLPSPLNDDYTLTAEDLPTAFAIGEVVYLDWDEAGRTMTNAMICVDDAEMVVTSDTRKLEDGKWYVVLEETVIDATNITVNGSANLILTDGSSLTIKNVADDLAAIEVAGNSRLTIYGQENGSGVLLVSGGDSGAGVGGGYHGACGTVTINGGTVTATGGAYGAGIGGGLQGAGGTVTINGGTVTATGGDFGAGIGGGRIGEGGEVVIRNGAVKVLAGENASVIGHGSGKDNDGTVSISGGIFGMSVADGWCADGCEVRDNPDPASAADYPWTVVLFVAVALEGPSEHATAAYTFGDGSVTNAVEGTNFKVVWGTENVKVIFTPEHNYRFKDTQETGVRALDSPIKADDAVTSPEVEGIPGTDAAPWQVGKNVTAYVSDEGVLVIGGTGAMSDFASAADVPWNSALVTAVQVANGVTLGKNALAGFADEVLVAFGSPVLSVGSMKGAMGASEPVIPEGKVLVSKEEIAAAKAETVTVDGGAVTLGVTVNTNGDLTAETKSWQPVELKGGNVKVENGKIVITIPVDSQSGFMILQSGDAKVGAGNAD